MVLRDTSIPVNMINAYHPRQASNVINYSPYALPGASIREPARAPSLHSSYATMNMPIYEPEYLYSAAHHHQHHPQHQQQFTASPDYYTQNFRRVERPLFHQQRGTQHRFRHHTHNMAYAPQMGNDDLAELQELSAKYEPEVKVSCWKEAVSTES